MRSPFIFKATLKTLQPSLTMCPISEKLKYRINTPVSDEFLMNSRTPQPTYQIGNYTVFDVPLSHFLEHSGHRFAFSLPIDPESNTGLFLFKLPEFMFGIPEAQAI